MPKQKYGRPSTGQKGSDRPIVAISRENYDEVDGVVADLETLSSELDR